MTVTMRRVNVPDESTYDSRLNAVMHTGRNAVDALQYVPLGADVATDIETPGLDNSFTINCITVSWWAPEGRIHSALLDPSRDTGHAAMAADVYARAGRIILHNAPFDIPSLVHGRVLTLDQVSKVVDTLVLARFAYPTTFGPLAPKNLAALATRLLGWTNHKGGLERAFRAAGYATIQAGYEGMDIDAPVYRRGALADTTATLLLEPLLRGDCVDLTLDHPFVDHGATSIADAAEIVTVQERVHRVMLKRSARGLAVDLDYLQTYTEDVDAERRQHELLLAQHGLEGGSGKGIKIVEAIEAMGQLPADWPRTPKTGRLSARKDDLDGLDHPLAAAQRGLAETDKVMTYLEKVSRQAAVTGRCHPQVSTLGASQTGRMSYSSPELQQFPAAARPIIVDDGQGLTSIDWSQIEPVTMALMARDEAFLAPFEAGNDLYEPIQRAAGIDRPLAKIVLLASMYGQGVKSLARKIKHTEESAAQIKRQMFAAMPRCEIFMSNIEEIAAQYGRIVTAGGRIIPIDPEGVFKAVNYICVSPGTPILTADLRHIPAATVSVGDELVGFDEHRSESTGRGTGKRFFRTALVEDVRTFVRPGVRIVAGDRVTICSAEHLWLVRCPGQNTKLQWIRADELLPEYHQMMDLGIWDTDVSREAGYLAGLYDGEGYLGRRQLVFSQKPGRVLDAFTSTMDKVGLTYSVSPRSPGSTSPTDNVRVHGLSRTLRTIGTLRPERFVARAREVYDGAELHTLRQMHGVPTVQSVTPLGDIDVVSIQTSTRTMVANGYLSHNCQGSAYDVLAHTICEMDRQGMGDALQLAMHDEVVVDTAAAADVQQIMVTAPPFLERWAGRTPVLRTDRADMGATWQKV